MAMTLHAPPIAPTAPVLPARLRRLWERITCVLPTGRPRLRTLTLTDLDTLPDGVRYHCPAPTSPAFFCMRPLPCTSHAVSTPSVGMLLYGSVLATGLEEPV